MLVSSCRAALHGEEHEMRTESRLREHIPRPRTELPEGGRPFHIEFGAWVAFVVVALLLLDVFVGPTYAAVIVTGALVLSLATAQWGAHGIGVDRRDLIWTAALYIGVVALFKLAFGGFTTDRTAPMFLSFAAAMLLGTLGPIVYTVWLRGRKLTSLGIGLHDLRTTLWLALVFGGVQFSITLRGYDLPAPAEWVPLLMMALTVGVFESIFFRGFMQGRLEASLGRMPAVVLASALYAAYHVGYGMGGSEIVFLFGLGLVYAIAYALSGNLLVLWPLLTPLGSFYAMLESGDLGGQLPWLSILSFVDVLVVITVAVVLARKHLRRIDRSHTREADAASL
jgi:membrane protease YdiL (CAAX protease family)